jgi:hypothetical protein
VLAPRSKWRREVVPKPRGKPARCNAARDEKPQPVAGKPKANADEPKARGEPCDPAGCRCDRAATATAISDQRSTGAAPNTLSSFGYPAKARGHVELTVSFRPPLRHPPEDGEDNTGNCPRLDGLTLDHVRLERRKSKMGMTKSKRQKGTQAALATNLAAGAQKRFPAGSSLSVGGVMLTLASIVTKLQGFAALRANVETARAALQAQLALESAQAIAMDAFIDAFVKIVRGSFGNQPDVLADFGLEPEKAATPLTVEEKAAAKAKAKATREARGTVGSKAKLKITGNVTGVTVTPVTTATPTQPTAAVGSGGGTSAPSATAPPAPHS